MRTFTLGGLAAAAALTAWPVAAESVPAFDVTDMWWNPAEGGWAISMMQSSATHQLYALWHTYDPREPETATGNANDFKPIWIVMTGGTWTTPTTIVGDAYVANGSPFWTTWNPGAFRITRVGRFTIDFSGYSQGTFTYEIAPPAGLAANDPAYGLPALTGTKSIRRFDF